MECHARHPSSSPRTWPLPSPRAGPSVCQRSARTSRCRPCPGASTAITSWSRRERREASSPSDRRVWVKPCTSTMRRHRGSDRSPWRRHDGGDVLRDARRRVGARRRHRRGRRPGLALDAAGARARRRRDGSRCTSTTTSGRPAFIALGIGLATGRPAVVLTHQRHRGGRACTPRSSRPTRPRCRCSCAPPTGRPSCSDVGAPQTIDQTHLYGGAVRWFADPGVPDDGDARDRGARSAARAVPRPPGAGAAGPGAPEPAVPRAAGRRARCRCRRAGPGGAPWHVGRRRAARRRPTTPSTTWPSSLDGRAGRDRRRAAAPAIPSAVHALAARARLAGARRPAVRAAGCPARTTVGAVRRPPAPPAVRRPTTARRRAAPRRAAGVEGARRSGWPARAPRAGAGRPARRVARSRARRPTLVVAGRSDARCAPRSTEPASGADRHAVARRAGATPRRGAQRAIDAVLDGARRADRAGGRPRRRGGAARRRHARGRRRRCRSATSSGTRAPRPASRVLANRGANGIDGVVSTAVGVALGRPAPTAVAASATSRFLHDTNGLLGARGRAASTSRSSSSTTTAAASSRSCRRRPRSSRGRFEQLFGTPHGVDLAALAAVHGIRRGSTPSAAGRACAWCGAHRSRRQRRRPRRDQPGDQRRAGRQVPAVGLVHRSIVSRV